jgi:hypothetical protein
MALLAVAQTVTLAVWFGQPAPARPQPVSAPPIVVPEVPSVAPSPAPEPSSYLVLSHAWDGESLPAIPATSSVGRPAKPLTAGSRTMLID